MKKIIQPIYKKHIRKYIKRPIAQQRFKLVLWDMYPYYKLLRLKNLTLFSKIDLIRKCLLVDWCVPHAHKPIELIPIFIEMSRRQRVGEEIMLEAGCWMGGSSAKFSLICQRFGYKLHIFDSFEGVEAGDGSSEVEKKFYGTYVGQIDQVKQNIQTYGVLEVCAFHKGWFINTMKELNKPVRIAYIDCDLAKGTREVLESVVPRLAKDGVIYSQDYHITTIKELLHDSNMWHLFDVSSPMIIHLARNLVSISWK